MKVALVAAAIVLVLLAAWAIPEIIAAAAEAAAAAAAEAAAEATAEAAAETTAETAAAEAAGEAAAQAEEEGAAEAEAQAEAERLEELAKDPAHGGKVTPGSSCAALTSPGHRSSVRTCTADASGATGTLIADVATIEGPAGRRDVGPDALTAWWHEVGGTAVQVLAPLGHSPTP